MSILGAPPPADISSSAANEYISKRNPMRDLLMAPEEQTARIMARPDYKPERTPRTDPFSNSGAIRGRFPTDLGMTAVSSQPLWEVSSGYERPPQPPVRVPQSLYGAPVEFFAEEKKEKNLISSPSNKTMNRAFQSNVAMTHASGQIPAASERPVLEDIDAPFEQAPLQSQDFSYLGSMEQPAPCAKKSERPDLSFSDPKQLLPKADIRQCLNDPTDPGNYMFDRTLFAPLKRRYGNVGTDYIRGDVYVAPNRFGWFDVPANPGTDLNAGFFNLNYPSFDQNVKLQDTEVRRTHPSVTGAQYDLNPYGEQSFHRGP